MQRNVDCCYKNVHNIVFKIGFWLKIFPNSLVHMYIKFCCKELTHKNIKIELVSRISNQIKTICIVKMFWQLWMGHLCLIENPPFTFKNLVKWSNQKQYRRVLSLSQQLLIYMLAKNSTINNNNFYFQYNETNTCRMEIIIQMQYSTVHPYKIE